MQDYVTARYLFLSEVKVHVTEERAWARKSQTTLSTLKTIVLSHRGCNHVIKTVIRLVKNHEFLLYIYCYINILSPYPYTAPYPYTEASVLTSHYGVYVFGKLYGRQKHISAHSTTPTVCVHHTQSGHVITISTIHSLSLNTLT